MPALTKTPRSLGYLAGSISQCLSDRLRANFRAAGIDLTHSEYVLLYDLFEEDGLTQQALATKVLKDKAAVKRTVDRLVAKGLVRRGAADTTRNNPVLLTELARRESSRFRRIAKRTLEEATEGIDPQALDNCLSVLRSIQAKLEGGRA